MQKGKAASTIHFFPINRVIESLIVLRNKKDIVTQIRPDAAVHNSTTIPQLLYKEIFSTHRGARKNRNRNGTPYIKKKSFLNRGARKNYDELMTSIYKEIFSTVRGERKSELKLEKPFVGTFLTATSRIKHRMVNGSC